MGHASSGFREARELEGRLWTYGCELGRKGLGVVQSNTVEALRVRLRLEGFGPGQGSYLLFINPYGSLDLAIQPVSAELLHLLSRFPFLTEIHILHPRPGLEDKKYDKETISDVWEIFKACPSAVRVGVGKNVVWERATPLDYFREAPIQLIDQKSVPRFFNAGSATNVSTQDFEELDEEGISEENEGLSDWLKKSS